jgi:hypothetical protein
MRDIHGNWIPQQFEKQFEVFNSTVRILLVCGPRFSGKTIATLHKICRHLWETDRGRVAMFARTLKSSKGGGTWDLLHRDIIPEWIAGNFGFRYTTDTSGIPGPKTDGLTRMPFFKVTNKFGTESEMMLFSLDDDDAVEGKIKNMGASMFYFSELDNFGDRRVLTVALASLRIGKFDTQMWIADCNPSEEGEQSWIYQCFFKERLMSYDEFAAHQRSLEIMPMSEQKFRNFYGNMNVIEIMPADNTFADPRQLEEIEVSCGTDLGLYARHILGKWVWGGGDSSRHFRQFFKPHHTIGDVSGPEEEWETLIPSKTCFELVTGWDLGDVNHAAVILERSYPDTALSRKLRMRLPYFSVIDELVSVGKEISHEEFARAVLSMIEFHERNAGYTYNLELAWSDSSSINRYSSLTDGFASALVMGATQERIILQGVPKAQGSVRVRVRLIKQLLQQDRLVVSAHCVKVIQMIKDLRKGKDEINYVVKNDPLKHPFDALSYPCFMECAEELQRSGDLPNTVRKSLGHVQVG